MTLKDKEMEKKLLKFVKETAEMIEKKADEFYTTEQDKLNFIMTAGINVLGNLTMRNSSDNMKDKVLAMDQTTQILAQWYQVVLDTIKRHKEAH